MNRVVQVAVTSVVALVVGLSLARSQDNVRVGLFGDADKAMSVAREKKANLYAPISFGKAMEYYKDADDDFKKGRNLEDIRAKLRAAISYLNKALEACKLAEVTFARVMAARTDALSADAMKYSTDLWNKAERGFNGAARDLEDGDVNAAKKGAGEAETIYRTAELEAIKGNYLAPARDLLKKADDQDVKDNAPKTLDKARRLSVQVENLLKQNRYDTDEARQIAQEAKYEATHAIYLHQRIAQSKKEDKSFEDVMLTGEDALRAVAGALDISAKFDAGTDGAVKDMIAEVNRRESKAAQDAAAIKQQESEIGNLKQLIASMETRLGTISEVEKALQNKLNEQKKQEETVVQVAAMFQYNEASVVRDGNNVIIRLSGLTFPVGRNTIESQFFPLLTKVQDAIKKFPGCQVAIEGHTDSQGGDEANQRLSGARAEAVGSYLMANLGASVPITNHQSQTRVTGRPIPSPVTTHRRGGRRTDASTW
ncbi:MAG: OmpA-like protein [Bacteroidetes bacterium]|nr:OmpA-like protein [Bacteroidota bacterium]